VDTYTLTWTDPVYNEETVGLSFGYNSREVERGVIRAYRASGYVASPVEAAASEIIDGWCSVSVLLDGGTDYEESFEISVEITEGS
jgi:hypothetical protein